MSAERPQLLAFLLCEDTLDQGGTTTLYRVIDTFNAELGIGNLPEEIASNIAYSIRFTVYVRWGVGAGEFEQTLVLVGPDGEETDQKVIQEFTKPEGFHFETFQFPTTLVVNEGGEYRWRLYLNGEQVAECPFRINITVTPGPGTLTPT